MDNEKLRRNKKLCPPEDNKKYNNLAKFIILLGLLQYVPLTCNIPHLLWDSILEGTIYGMVSIIAFIFTWFCGSLLNSNTYTIHTHKLGGTNI